MGSPYLFCDSTLRCIHTPLIFMWCEISPVYHTAPHGHSITWQPAFSEATPSIPSHTKHPFPHQASLSPQALVNALQILRNCWGARYGTRLQHRLPKYSSTLPLIRHDKHHKCGSASQRGSTMEQLASALRNVFYQHPSGSSSSPAEICTATVTDRITMPLDIIAHTHQAVSSRFFK